MLLLLEDGERKPIGLQRFEGVVVFWRQFVRRYLADAPSFGLGSRYAAGRTRANGRRFMPGLYTIGEDRPIRFSGDEASGLIAVFDPIRRPAEFLEVAA